MNIIKNWATSYYFEIGKTYETLRDLYVYQQFTPHKKKQTKKTMSLKIVVSKTKNFVFTIRILIN